MWYVWGEHQCLQGVGGGTSRKETLGRSRRIWEENIKIYLRETEWERFSWISLAQDGDEWRALVNTPLKLRVS